MDGGLDLAFAALDAGHFVNRDEGIGPELQRAFEVEAGAGKVVGGAESLAQGEVCVEVVRVGAQGLIEGRDGAFGIAEQREGHAAQSVDAGEVSDPA